MEREFEARAVIVRQFCDQPGCNGEMLPSGNIMVMCDPPLAPHACNSCGAAANYTDRYPTTRFKQIGESHGPV